MVKKIHQIWVQGEENFKENQPIFYSYIDLWKNLFPDYEYKLWSENDYLPLIEEFSLDLYNIYHTLPSYAAKSDIARLIILYAQKGDNLYVDTDYEPFKRFDYLINDPKISLCLVGMDFCKSKVYFADYKYSNAWIYAKGGCPYIRAMLDRIIRHPYDSKKYSKFEYIWSVSGPKALTMIVETLDLTNKSDVRILPSSLIEVANFSNCSIITLPREEILKHYSFAVGIHRMAASWIDSAHFLKKLGIIYTFWNDYPDFIALLFLFIIFIQAVIIFFI